MSRPDVGIVKSLIHYNLLLHLEGMSVIELYELHYRTEEEDEPLLTNKRLHDLGERGAAYADTNKLSCLKHDQILSDYE